jgi:outer membrane protein OmpA-like peptidoglycan-associated protein/tetratricopeptide (TPR) repeat protein
MKLKLLFSIVLVAFLMNATRVNAQSKRLKTANKKYTERSYIDAAVVYERVVKSGFKSIEILKRLGNTYYFNANYKKAAQWYAELIALKNLDEPIYYLRYSQSLRTLGKDSKATQMYDTFLKEYDHKGTVKDVQSYLKIIEKNSDRYAIKAMKSNSSVMEFGGFFSGDLFYFTSSAPKKGLSKMIDHWTDGYFLDVFTAKYDSVNHSFDNVERAKQKINTKPHDVSLVISKDGKTMYITRNNNSINTPEGKEDSGQLKIYRASLNDKGDWDDFEDLAINSDLFSTAHAVLSSNEKVLYFASNRPGGYGETDIYRSFIEEDGSLRKPQNLGPEVNTKGRESFPFITQNNELYFSSEGHFGLGGYDVFYVDLKKEVLQIVNIGKPVNSKQDDFAFSINPKGKGVISSNRASGRGLDDIYLFTETKPISEAINTLLTGVVIDDKTELPILGAELSLRDTKNILITKVKTNQLGEYAVKINRFYDHIIDATEPDYEGKNDFIKAAINAISIERNFRLTKTKIEVVDGLDIRGQLNMPPIYFAFNKFKIESEAALELEKIVALLEEYPNINIEVRSHTDSRGKDNYNLALSEKRAKATVAYIRSRGISVDRIQGKGFGETMLVNQCDNDTKCSKETHYLNRRSEFMITLKKEE